jgi:hypothetical protein
MVSPHLFPDDRLVPSRRSSSPELSRPRQAEKSAVGEQSAKSLCHFEVGRLVRERTQELGRDVIVDELPK